MYPKLCALVLLILCILGSSSANECEPQSVQNLSVNAFHILSWSVNENEFCEITEFLVQIWQVGFPEEYTLTVTEPELDVSFLHICEEWTFLVTPISFYTSGRGRRLIQTLPIPADANMTLSYLNLTSNDTTGEVHLQWDLIEDKPSTCHLLYRITIELDGDPSLEDIYVRSKFLDLHFLSPCVSYKFSVRTFNTASPNLEGPVKTATHSIPPKRQQPPALYELKNGVREVNTTWRMDSFVRNMCRTTEFRIDDVNGTFNNYYALDSFQRGIEVNINSLEPDTLYTIRAYVHNTAGWSAPSEVTFKTLEDESG